MKNHSFDIRQATTEDIETVASIIASNFSNDPVFAWIVYQANNRLRMALDFFKVYSTFGIEQGIVHIAENQALGAVGAAIWFKNNTYDPTVDQAIADIIGEPADRLAIFGQQLDAHLPPVDNYYKLMAISSLPSAHGLGVGRALVTHQLHHLDTLGISAYLEATTRLSAGGVYQRLGFQPIGEPIKFADGIEIFPMWRPAEEIPFDFNLRHIEYDGLFAQTLRMADLDWRILEIQDGKALVITEQVIEQRPYHPDFDSVKWFTSETRNYLNHEFYQRFTPAEQARILETTVESSNNPWFGTDAGKSVQDKLFLLSINQTVQYFGNSGQLAHKNDDTKHYISDEYNNMRKTLNTQNSKSAWWLRTPGSQNTFVAHVTADGRICVSGDFVNRGDAFYIGIRPAMWVTYPN